MLPLSRQRAAAFLTGRGRGDSLRFKCRRFTGARCPDDVSPDWLVLDGQQRLTTLYQVFRCKKAVETRLDTNRDKTIFRYYYLDIQKCLDPDADRLDAIVSISDKKQVLSDIGRTVVLDLSTPENEFEHLMFPLNLVFYDFLAADDFDAYFADRAIKLLNRIEKATGKSISGRDSEETIKEFGQALL